MKLGKSPLSKLQFNGDTVGRFFKGKPSEEVLEVAFDSQWQACTVFEFFAYGFNFIIMLIEESMGISEIDQASDHT